jgi:hypothetical protein
MQYYYSKSTNGFYVDEVHGTDIPKDAVKITEKQHSDLMAGQQGNKVIGSNAKGQPILVDPPALSYDVLRRGEYPSIGDQLDALYKAGVFPADMAAKIKAVKDKYPKQ